MCRRGKILVAQPCHLSAPAAVQARVPFLDRQFMEVGSVRVLPSLNCLTPLLNHRFHCLTDFFGATAASHSRGPMSCRWSVSRGMLGQVAMGFNPVQKMCKDQVDHLGTTWVKNRMLVPDVTGNFMDTDGWWMIMGCLYLRDKSRDAMRTRCMK